MYKLNPNQPNIKPQVHPKDGRPTLLIVPLDTAGIVFGGLPFDFTGFLGDVVFVVVALEFGDGEL
jgi:hypothetical protein